MESPPRGKLRCATQGISRLLASRKTIGSILKTKKEICMNLQRLILPALSICLCAISLNAQMTHTWVSVTGNDSTGTGTPAKPFATFQVAANHTSAGGIISVLGPGDYGPLTINNALTVDGTGGGSITFSGTGIGVNAPTNATVVLRNLTINGGGIGSEPIAAGQFLNLVIDGCRLEGFTDFGVAIASSSAENVAIHNTTIVGGQIGVRVFQGGGPDKVSLDHVTIQGQSEIGVFTRSGLLDISDSVVTQSGTGLEADTNATVKAERVMLSGNGNGVCMETGTTAQLNNTDLFDNTTGVAACGGTVTGSANSSGPPARATPAIIAPMTRH
jgi:hypothetical protein